MTLFRVMTLGSIGVKQNLFWALFALSNLHRTSEQNRTNGFFVLFDKDR
jgi:hypothetical protein